MPLILFAALVVSDKYGEKGLIFAETGWDFGKISGAKSLTHKFAFKNNSDSTIHIDNIVPDCGCMAAVPVDNSIEPGEYGVIEVTFNPVGKTRHFSSNVRVETNEKKPFYLLSLTAYIETRQFSTVNVKYPKPSITVQPVMINLGTIKMGQKAFYNIVIGNAGEGELYIRNIKAENSSGVPLNRKPLKKGKEIELTALYEATKKGKIDDYLRISSNDPDRPLIKVRIIGTVD